MEIFWYKVDTIVLKDNSKQQKQLFLEPAGINGCKTISYTEVTDVIAEGTAIQRLMHQSKSFRQRLEVTLCSHFSVQTQKLTITNFQISISSVRHFLHF
jgi:hypothetical protein